MKKEFYAYLPLLIFLVLLPRISDAKVLFSEVFYDTPGTDAVEEWIELYNTSTSVNLSGWTIIKLTEGSSYTYVIPDVTLGTNEFLVIARDANGFKNLYGFLPDISNLTLSLSNSGGKLSLRDGSDLEKDFVAWEKPSIGWDIEAKTGQSIERFPLTQDTDSVNDWIVQNSPNPGSAVPEPTTVVLLLCGAAGLYYNRRRTLRVLPQNHTELHRKK